MARMTSQARSRLDPRLQRLRPLASEPLPHRGWIRAIRDALGMSSSELAARMGVIQQSISDLEGSEVHDTIKLETLRRGADAPHCDLLLLFSPPTPRHEDVH